jgi:hypothetical protein
MAILLVIFGLLWFFQKPQSVAERTPKAKGPELLILKTKETPEVNYQLIGTVELRFDQPLSIKSDFIMGIGRAKSAKNMELDKSTVELHSEGSTVELKEKGAYYVMIFTRNLDGKPSTAAAVRVMIIIGPWPHPVDRRLLQPVPEWIRIAKAPPRGFVFIRSGGERC